MVTLPRSEKVTICIDMGMQAYSSKILTFDVDSEALNISARVLL